MHKILYTALIIILINSLIINFLTYKGYIVMPPVKAGYGAPINNGDDFINLIEKAKTTKKGR